MRLLYAVCIIAKSVIWHSNPATATWFSSANYVFSVHMPVYLLNFYKLFPLNFPGNKLYFYNSLEDKDNAILTNIKIFAELKEIIIF